MAENYIGNALMGITRDRQQQFQNSLALRNQAMQESVFGTQRQQLDMKQLLAGAQIVQMAAQRGESPKAVAEQISPNFVKEFEAQHGAGSWQSLDDQSVLKMARGLELHAMQQLGESHPPNEKPIAVLGDNGKPTYVPESQAYGKTPYSNTTDAKPAASIQEYNTYIDNMKKAGKEAEIKPFLEFSKDLAVAKAQYPYALGEVGGVPTLVNRTSAGLSPAPGVAPAQPTTRPLSTLPTEARAKGTLAQAGAEGTTTGHGMAERVLNQPVAQQALGNSLQGLDSLSKVAGDIANSPALTRITGATGVIPNFPGSAASDTAAQLNTLKSKIAFSVLQAMRDASKSGGALGQVSEKEIDFLQNNIAALDPKQSPEAFKKQLLEIVKYAEGAKGRLQSAYSQTYPDSSGTQFQTTPQFGQDPNDPLGIRRAIPR